MMELRYMSLFVLFLLSGCLARERPIANLKFSSFQQSGARHSITFYSDQAIDALFFPDKGEKTVSRSVICALGEDRDFRVEHNLEKLFDGDLVLEKKEGARSYRYTSSGNFFLSWDDDTYRRVIESGEVLNLMGDKQEVECKVVITVYLYRPYYSHAMKIPVAALVEVLKKVPPPPPCCHVQDSFKEK